MLSTKFVTRSETANIDPAPEVDFPMDVAETLLDVSHDLLAEGGEIGVEEEV